MSTYAHRYFCGYCRSYIGGETLTLLAWNVNEHNKTFHPTDFCRWTEALLTNSNNYSYCIYIGDSYYYHASNRAMDAKPSAALEQYTIPHGTTPKRDNLATTLPILTDFDKKFLAKALVRWD